MSFNLFNQYGIYPSAGGIMAPPSGLAFTVNITAPNTTFQIPVDTVNGGYNAIID